MMNYLDMITTEVIGSLTRLSEITGFSSNVLVCIFSLVLLLSIFGLFILLKLRSIGKALLEVNQRLDALAQRLARHPPPSDSVLVEKYLGGHIVKEVSKKQESKEAEKITTPKNQKPFSFLTGNSDLKSVLLDLINNADAAISLQDIVSQLSEDYFDGNYHPIINNLDELEKDKKIEGQSISGKVFFKIK
ncbi:MAG: hypothetical protein PVG70_19790 [Desulfobacterales bacterium]|jgi:hypothetical protein